MNPRVKWIINLQSLYINVTVAKRNLQERTVWWGMRSNVVVVTSVGRYKHEQNFKHTWPSAIDLLNTHVQCATLNFTIWENYVIINWQNIHNHQRQQQQMICHPTTWVEGLNVDYVENIVPTVIFCMNIKYRNITVKKNKGDQKKTCHKKVTYVVWKK